jgi:hypothetical protein
VRIASVWEGTTQIQALDLLGRKILAQKFKPIKAAAEEVFICMLLNLGLMMYAFV